MLHRMITAARDRWYASPDCKIGPVVDYIAGAGQMRDAQVGAIRTYLFLKIKCGNRPLAALFSDGAFNNLDLRELELKPAVLAFLKCNPAAAALYEYATLKNDSGEQVSKKLEQTIKNSPDAIDYAQFWHNAFYGVAYTDYLFSLPMGAGKTYLMAAFIYLDLYFALNEPSNPAFAHNFIIFAPSGLKSSIVPSLRTIQGFDPTWVIPEPSASEIKRRLLFEVLDQGRAAKKSNRTKNPNVQKIAAHQPFSSLFGLVAVTNAEKVILDRVRDTAVSLPFGEESKDDRDRQANELRNMLGQLPSLSIFIDEVHHAVSDEIKLRAVVTKWAHDNNSINSVIGFSGTPYLPKAEKLSVSDGLSVAGAEIANTVYYYPLVNGVGNFLKRPIVKYSDTKDSVRIVEAGVREFLDKYKDTVYAGGLWAKLGIYCGTIEKLERIIYPVVSRVAAEYGLPPDAVLKFHRGNSDYKPSLESQLQFDTLDRPMSRIRVVLLVQIGKEGWDCRSLTGIILSQEGDCDRTMVLQTSCRCLRQVVKNSPETALIYLNEGNAALLNRQLEQQHHISLKEFEEGGKSQTDIKRYDRTAYLKLPAMGFYQLKVRYETQTLEVADPAAAIAVATRGSEIAPSTTKTQDFATREVTGISLDDAETGGEQATFASWLYGMAKASFGFVPMELLNTQETLLRNVFDAITNQLDGARCFSSKFDRALVEANIRKAFYDKRGYTTKDELIPQEAHLLKIEHFAPTVPTATPSDYYPSQPEVEKIVAADTGEPVMAKQNEAIEVLEKIGRPDMARQLARESLALMNRDSSFHYLPYKTDSGFEETFLKEMLALADKNGTKLLDKYGLEIYYNGDRALTEFRIRCYKKAGRRWDYIGIYTPDFLIVRRRDGSIHSAIIVETKGRAYANDPRFQDRRAFMETRFTPENNREFGYRRFEYLCLEDSMLESERIAKTHQAITDFFGEGADDA